MLSCWAQCWLLPATGGRSIQQGLWWCRSTRQRRNKLRGRSHKLRRRGPSSLGVGIRVLHLAKDRGVSAVVMWRRVWLGQLSTSSGWGDEQTRRILRLARWPWRSICSNARRSTDQAAGFEAFSPRMTNTALSAEKANSDAPTEARPPSKAVAAIEESPTPIVIDTAPITAAAVPAM